MVGAHIAGLFHFSAHLSVDRSGRSIRDGPAPLR
jgi:hypothetical protein